MRGVYTVWLREMKRFFRDRARIVGNLVMPFIWLVIMGTGLSSALVMRNNDMDYFNFLAPGIIGMTLLFTSIFAGVSVIWEKQFGFMKEMLVSPISRLSIVFGKVLGSATISVFNGIMVLAITVIFKGVPLSSLTVGGVLLAIVFMALISFSFVSIGLMIAAKMNSMEGFHMIMSFLVMPLFFLSGAFFPIDQVPTWMRLLAQVDPLMYGVDGLRGALVGGNIFSLGVDLLVLAGFGFILIWFASRLFSKMQV